MSTAADHTPLKKPPKQAAVPRPSSSVLLISPQNQILLLHRVQTSSSFASAHVFPGGVLSAEHDGEIPAPESPVRHVDGPSYRMAAIRETFEECGILLARKKGSGKDGGLWTGVDDEERERGRRDVHAGKVRFGELLEGWGVEADVENLIPFTRWITPPNVPKRFTTQMYLYFLPLSATTSESSATSTTSTSSSSTPIPDSPSESETIIPTPTHDGGIEHTAARFLPPHKWLSLARENKIILFPPQFFLMHILSPFLSSTVTSLSSLNPSISDLSKERLTLLNYLGERRTYKGQDEPTFTDACISPIAEISRGGPEYGGVDKGTAILRLDFSGKEAGQGRRGFREWVVTTKFKKDGPRDVDVARRDEVLGVKGKL
ncbi:hypothetical protein GQ43DRAFT_381828 [Delitschia confertaspora ATCC 74209]|uniref:Nudix hydrolase domain-containing protein n=1 Tax=Delitschia confertaspora ATCC 74209 TaxID=1513339 RepID=A0A9P4JI26_9PLEO|nr:hypothetical protein GQ43DRAFT_381828 [Delitschia confertaspora ATCC 74209]